jgi:hypothetical protein
LVLPRPDPRIGNAYQYRNYSRQYCKRSGLVFCPVACPEPIFCDYYDVYLISSQVTGCPEARPEPMLIAIAIIHTSIACIPGLVFCPVACPEPISILMWPHVVVRIIMFQFITVHCRLSFNLSLLIAIIHFFLTNSFLLNLCPRLFVRHGTLQNVCGILTLYFKTIKRQNIELVDCLHSTILIASLGLARTGFNPRISHVTIFSQSSYAPTIRPAPRIETTPA